jgi:hypothetical protein
MAKAPETVSIKMLATARGADEGKPLAEYVEGQVYEVHPFLARAFVDELKVAERTGVAGVADKVADAVDGVVAAVKGKGKKVDDPPKD